MQKFSIAQIAKELGANASGDLTIEIENVAEPHRAGKNDLALAMDPKFSDGLKDGRAQAAILWAGADFEALGLKAAIFAPRSRYVLSGVSYFFEKPPKIEKGIHATAIVSPDAEIGNNAAIGPYCIVESGAKIGRNARLQAHCFVGEGASIGNNALLYSGVHIGARCMIGDNFISQAGSVVGADGFSYVTPQPGAVEEARETGKITESSQTAGFARINSLGAVALGDNVELGANCAIDRGTISNTSIGDGTKLDNLVHIGHNVQIGQTCLICGQVGIAGSTQIGDRVVLGGQVGVADHLVIGSDVIAAGKSGISSNVPSNRVMMGSPAMKMDLNIESYKALRRLPRLVRKVEALEEKLKASK